MFLHEAHLMTVDKHWVTCGMSSKNVYFLYSNGTLFSKFIDTSRTLNKQLIFMKILKTQRISFFLALETGITLFTVQQHDTLLWNLM